MYMVPTKHTHNISWKVRQNCIKIINLKGTLAPKKLPLSLLPFWSKYLGFLHLLTSHSLFNPPQSGFVFYCNCFNCQIWSKSSWISLLHQTILSLFSLEIQPLLAWCSVTVEMNFPKWKGSQPWRTYALMRKTDYVQWCIWLTLAQFSYF